MTDNVFDSPADHGIYISKSDLVAAALREHIVTGALEPGAPLRQRHLAARFGVSATPVREALRRLESEGLIVNDAHRGSTVAKSAGNLHEKVEIRAVLEALAARQAAPKVHKQHIFELRAYNARLLVPDLSPADLDSVNRHFHFHIYEIADNPLLMSLMRLLWQSFPGRPHGTHTRTASYDEHDALIRALERGDAEEASHLTHSHVLGILEKVDHRTAGPLPEAAST